MKKEISAKKLINMLLMTFVIVIAITSIIGQGAGIVHLRSFDGTEVTMTFASSILAMMSALIIFIENRIKEWLIPMIVVLSLTCLYILSSWYFNNSKPVFFPLFESDSLVSLDGDVPSFGTITAFLLFGLNVCFRNKTISYLISLIGMIAFFGHAIDCEILYWKFTQYPTGVSLNTALVLILLGIYQRINYEVRCNKVQ